MIISVNDQLEELPARIFNLLSLAVSHKEHPLRFAVLSTVVENLPKSRYVVLRDITQDDQLIFFTDSRSEKVRQLALNPGSSIVFFDSVEQLQISLTATVTMHQNDDKAEAYRSQLSDFQKKSYTSVYSPGSLLDHPVKAHEWNLENDYFMVLECKPIEMEILQINGYAHIRARFTNKKGIWTGNWISP